EAHRRLGHDRCPRTLASEALLQLRKRKRHLVAPGQYFTIEDGSRWQRHGRGDDLRELRTDDLLAARPEFALVFAAHDLAADAIPLPLRQPALACAQFGDGTIERRSE